MSGDRGTAPNPAGDGIYRLIQALMILDMLAGAVLIAIGLFVAPAPELVIVGIGLALIGGALFLFFRRLARRAASRAKP